MGVALWASLASAQAPNWPSERPPRPLAPREVKFPPYETRTLANGMQVVIVLHHEQPAVSMRLLVRAGSLQDPRGKAGVASLVASLLDQGTTTRGAQQIADQIDFIGGALNTGSNPDWISVNVVVMKDSFDFGMDLLADVVRNPAFAPEEIDRQKEQIVSALQVNLDDPDYVASVVFDRLVYGFHPYGLPNSGTPETLDGITREDLQAHHRRHFVPNNLILAIVGDVTSEEALAGAERAFGRWPRGEIVQATPIDPPPPTRRVVIVDKPDAVQTEIRVGQVAIPRKHDDYMAFDLAVKILGGEGANRLHRVLRAERGLTYGASAETDARKEAGNFVAETDTRTETTGETLRLMVDEFSRLQRQRVFERELSDAQAYQAGSFPLTIETPNDIATQVLRVVFYELPVEEIGTFRERVQAVTPDDIQRVARQYVRPDRLSIVLVGNASAFVPQLRQAGFSEFEIIPLDELDLMSATLRVQRLRVEAPASAPVPAARRDAAVFVRAAYGPTSAQAVQTDARAVDLLRRIIDAKGGLDALRRVRTVVAEAETTFRMVQGTLASATRTYVAYPDKFRVDATLDGAEVIQVFNAGQAWQRDPGGVRDAPAPLRDEFASSVRRDTIPLLIAAAEGRLAVRALPEEGRDGQVLEAIEISGERLDPVTLYADAQHLIARQAFATTRPDGRPIRAEEIFSDYRRVDGIQVPFKAELLHDGRPILSRTLTGVTLNSPLDDGLFTRPE
ncbi:MAG: insulinase family protein [Acidobacteria bacterium]|nr:insulinase family protein [Acidobacteriota bacterium]